MSGLSIGLIIYGVILVVVCLRILYETHSSTKTIAYLLFCIFVPFIGIGFYLAFGINYWKLKLYSNKLAEDKKLLKEMNDNLDTSAVLTKFDVLDDNEELATMLVKILQSPITSSN